PPEPNASGLSTHWAERGIRTAYLVRYFRHPRFAAGRLGAGVASARGRRLLPALGERWPGFSFGLLPFFPFAAKRPPLQTRLRRSGGLAPSGVATGQVASVGASTAFHG